MTHQFPKLIFAQGMPLPFFLYFQLAHCMRHPHVVRCLAFYHTTAGDTYVTHIDKGYTNEVNVWTISSIAETEMKVFRLVVGG